MGHGNRHRNDNNTGLIEDIESFIKRRENGEVEQICDTMREDDNLRYRKEDAQRRLSWILKDSLRFGASAKDPFWIKAACLSWRSRPHIGSYDNPELGALGICRIYVVKKPSKPARGQKEKEKAETETEPGIDIGMIKFGPAGGIIGLKIHDCKGNVLFSCGEFENDFDVDVDRWSPLIYDFYLLGDSKPPLF